MLKIRRLLVALGLLLCSAASAAIQVSIGINVPVYPEFVVVPGYPVYYAPRLQANFFFYDGMYWVYQDDYWYMSSWYNGPWLLVEPEYVPVFVLRVPVRYYRRPPVYFLEWRQDAPPRWGDHWGRDWEQHRSGWDRWERRSAPAPAPLPVYQRAYSGERYPRQVEQQQELQQQKYRYQPRDPVVRQQSRELSVQQAPARQQKQGTSSEPSSRQLNGPAESQQRGNDIERSTTPTSPQRGRREGQEKQPLAGPGQREQEMQSAPPQPQRQRAPTERSSRQQDTQRSAPPQPQPDGPSQRERAEVQDHGQLPPSELDQRGQQMPRSQGAEEKQQGRDAKRKPKQGQEEERGRDSNE